MLNRYIGISTAHNLPVFATRDWHPEHHCAFSKQGGPWPPYCVQGTHGAEFSAALRLSHSVVIISKAAALDYDGPTTDDCVKNSTRDAWKASYQVSALADAIRAVDVQPGDGKRALEEMLAIGAGGITQEGIVG